jgi:hypothetical protein
VQVLSAPDMRERLIAQGAEAAPDTPAEFARFIADEQARYARIVKASGARVDCRPARPMNVPPRTRRINRGEQ